MKYRPPLAFGACPPLLFSGRRVAGAPPCPRSPPRSIDPWYAGMRDDDDAAWLMVRLRRPTSSPDALGVAAARRRRRRARTLLARGAARQRQRQWSRSCGSSFAVADTAWLEVLRRTCRRDWKQQPRRRSTALSSSSQPMGARQNRRSETQQYVETDI